MSKEVERVKPSTGVIVYICPTKGCGNYYASPTFRPDRSDIESIQKRRRQDGKRIPSHARIDCPDCREKGMRVKRVAYVVVEVVSLDAAMALKKAA